MRKVVDLVDKKTTWQNEQKRFFTSTRVVF
jgi:hypothetical protein